MSAGQLKADSSGHTPTGQDWFFGKYKFWCEATFTYRKKLWSGESYGDWQPCELTANLGNSLARFLGYEYGNDGDSPPSAHPPDANFNDIAAGELSFGSELVLNFSTWFCALVGITVGNETNGQDAEGNLYCLDSIAFKFTSNVALCHGEDIVDLGWTTTVSESTAHVWDA